MSTLIDMIKEALRQFSSQSSEDLPELSHILKRAKSLMEIDAQTPILQKKLSLIESLKAKVQAIKCKDIDDFIIATNSINRKLGKEFTDLAKYGFIDPDAGNNFDKNIKYLIKQMKHRKAVFDNNQAIQKYTAIIDSVSDLIEVDRNGTNVTSKP